MTLRDPQGRLIRATPEQKVAAHVERVNALHRDPMKNQGRGQNLDNANWNLNQAQYFSRQQSQFPSAVSFSEGGGGGVPEHWKDQAANEVFADLPKDQSSFRDAYAVFSEPKRSQPIEYEDGRQVWQWVLGCGAVAFILLAAIWVLTH
jgi:hypothetical protein